MILTNPKMYDKFGVMFRNTIQLVLLMLLVIACGRVEAFWVWTPESGKWTNPKYSVKETPKEQLDFALEYVNNEDYKQAIKEFEKLIKNYPRAREASEAQYFIAVSFEKMDKIYEAFKQYQKVIDKYPYSERSSQIVEQQYKIGEILLDGELSKKGFWNAFEVSDYNVIDVFKTVIRNAPYGDLAPQAQYKIGLYLLEKHLYQEARDEFEKVLNDFPHSEWAKAAKYKIALSDTKRSSDAQYDQKITEAAVEEFEDFVEEYPDAELSKEAKGQIYLLREKEAENSFVVAQFYEKQKNFKAAKIYYQAVVDDYANSSWASKALVKIQGISKRTR